ncbi:MAG: LPS export ABC transporter permease LptF [Desulfohalobiaceae bacterium]|nr:LPS export ABC transporter permease LptF [Desulfohalobiaceae bacterium]
MIFKPCLLKREITKELLAVFALCLSIFLSLLLLGKILKLREVLFALDLAALDLAELFVYLTPFFLMLLIPVACMISMFLTFQRMSSDRELTALRAGGVSLLQILPAPAFFLLACAVINGFVSFYGLAWGVQNFQNTVLELAREKAQLSLRPGVFNNNFPGLIIYAGRVDPVSGVVGDVFVQDYTNQDAGLNIVAPQGRILTDNEQGKILFSLDDGHIYRQDGNENDILNFSQYRIALNLHKLLGDIHVRKDKPRSFSWGKLNALLSEPSTRAEKGQGYLRSLKVEKQKRLSLPVACLVLGFFAFPLGWIFQGVKRYYGAILILVMFFVYYAFFSMGISLGETGVLPPVVGVWAPNFFFGVISLFFFHLAIRERGGFLIAWIWWLQRAARSLLGKKGVSL